MNSESNPFRIKGVVIDNKSQHGLKGLRVEAWDKDFLFDDALGFADTDHQGAFEICFDENRFQGFFERNPDLYFKIFYHNNCIGSTEKSVLWNKESGDIPVRILIDKPEGYESSCPPSVPDEPEQKQRPNTPDHFVQGRLTDANKTGLSHYTIVLSEYDLNGTKKIDSVTTGKYGAFEFEFAFGESLRKGDASTEPDLEFQVFEPSGAKVDLLSIFTLDGELETEVSRLSESKQAPIVLVNTPNKLTLRIAVDLHQRPITEFEQLITQLKPFLGEIEFADLKEDETHFQVSFLSKDSGIDKTKIEQLRDAFQQDRESEGVPAWAFYGLATQAIALTNAAAMALEELVSVLKPLQPSCDQHHLEAVANNLKHFVKKQAIQAKVTDFKASTGDLLLPILESEDRLNTFLGAYARHEGDIESFWKGMSQNREFQAEVPKIQLNLQLSQLTLNNKGLVTALQQLGIEDTRQLVDISPGKWEALALANKAGIPEHITGDDDQARAKIYAQELQTLVEASFPTDVIKKSIQHREVNTFLNNNPEFDFTLTPVETYLQGQGERALKHIDNPEAVKNQLRKIQRLYTLTANTADMNVLMDMEYESANQIAKLSLEDFTRNLTGKVTKENAQLYHAKALAVSDATSMVYMQLRDLVVSQNFRATDTKFGDIEASKDMPNFEKGRVYWDALKVDSTPSMLGNIPNWESLFGPIDTCECQHCKSVYSPAAYFVDLLHILLGQNNGAVRGAARKELFRRRPDLRYTKLSCEHTETLIPYIDLVNEVLETYVAQDDVGNPKADEHAVKSTNDTSDFSASDLAANPQHPNIESSEDAKNAYALLKNAIFPLNLPFDMDLEVARQFLHQQKSSRFDVLNVFKNASSNAIAAERIGISPREFEILTLKQLDGTPSSLKPSDLWGLPGDEPLGQALVKVRDFLNQSNIAYTDLIDLLKTHFLNPYFPINEYLQKPPIEDDGLIAVPPDLDQRAKQAIGLVSTNPKEAPCDLNQTEIRHLDSEPLSDAEMSNFNRFIRLWKKLGCTIPELDALLTAIPPVDSTDITPQVIQDLSALWQVHKDLDLPLDKAAVLVGNIPTYGKDSLFARLFLNKAIQQIDDKFRLNIDQKEVEHSSELLEPHVPAILAALQITEEDLNRIVAFTSLNIKDDTLIVANLSKIYRYVVFAKGLKLKINDLLTWFDLTGQTSWGTGSELIKTKELLEKLNRYGFKAADFAYIFKNVSVAGNMLPPKDEVIQQSVKTLREGLQKITQENKPTDGIVTIDFLTHALGNLLDADETTKVIGILLKETIPPGSNETNSPYKFGDLLKPKISDIFLDKYKAILNDYLTDADLADLEATTDIPERLKKYWDKIKVKLLPVLRQTFIQQHLAAEFKADSALIAYFLQDTDILNTCLAVEQDSTHNDAYIDRYLKLNKSLWLIGKLKLTHKELSYFQGNANFNSFNWRDFNFADWLRIADFVALRDSLPVAEKDLLSIFEAVRKGDSVAETIIEVTAWDKANVEYFVRKPPRTDLNNEIPLIVLQKQIDLSKRIGVSIENLESWATDNVTYDQAKVIKRSLKAKYDETAWIDVSTQIHNRIRNHLRDALVAYLLQKAEIKALGLKDSNDLYSFFLIDVEMDACMLTSRLKQAIASVQLFVQRCLLNLESHKAETEQVITPNLIDASQWKWMKNYRVWEANRKVFLYPENWIEPELRDDKSPFFKELESELLQGEVTNDSVEKALMNYLEKLHDVARLDILGTWEDQQGQELHVFGRTFNTPAQYFYRKLDLQTQVWTAWEKVQLDIQGNEVGESAGVHLIPVVWNRRLYLFWPIFTEKQDKEEYKLWKIKLALWESARNKAKDAIAKGEHVGLGISGALRAPKPEEPSMENAYWEVRIAWSEYKNKKWSNKKVSQSFIRTPSNSNGVLPIDAYRFSVNLDIALSIKLYYHHEIPNVSFLPIVKPIVFPDFLFYLGEFQINCYSKVSVFHNINKNPEIQVINPKQVNFYQGFLSGETGIDRSILWHDENSYPFVLRDGNNNREILTSSVQEYKVVFPADHDFSYNSGTRFFYQDQQRSYFVDNTYITYKRAKHIGLHRPYELAIPVRYLDKPVPSVDFNIGKPPPLHVEKGHSITESLVYITDTRQISVSTSLQLQAMQTFEVASFANVEQNSLSFSAWALSNLYWPLITSPPPYLLFKPFFHAYLCNFMEALAKYGINGLLTLQNQIFSDITFTYTQGGITGSQIPTGLTNNFEKIYGPRGNAVWTPYPLEEVDFSPSGAYSLYNWELFFHVPMLLANRLSKNQRFEEAMRWYHFVFNPTTNENLDSSERYWQVMPFRNTAIETLQQLFKHLEPNDPNRQELEDAITAWRKDPFKPHLIARTRLLAYQKNTVMKYLDNLIAWADSLFRQDTIESINEATQLYILAAELLGKRPDKIPTRTKNQAFSYAELEAKPDTLDSFSNALVYLETMFPHYNLQPVVVEKGTLRTGVASILSTAIPTLYFCLPDNDKLLGYWDTVADRLFKIRHCQNIEGIERQLALFEPPIDPALLVQAVAGGVDISSVLADLNSPLPYYRFNYILQKALEMCAELKSLGNSLLSALEKKDGEAITLMRSQFETMQLSMAKTVKKLQITEAERNREGLEKTQEITQVRFEYYSELIKTNLIEAERDHSKKLEMAKDRQDDAYGVELAASIAHILPNVNIPIGTSFGGTNIGSALNAWGKSINNIASGYTYEANRSSINATNERRMNEWIFQQKLAKNELTQIDRQILAAQIREQIADQELTNQEQQIDNAHQVEDFYRNKFTQEELYGWMVGEISTNYFQCYQLAYDLSKKAEKTYRYELGLSASNFIQFGIWDSFRKGLMSGERLYLSLKQMEKSYMDQNRREFEITKNISLVLIDPMALIKLKYTGSCYVDLPETLFDVDYPGHYMRRIKSVSITIPCVAGPYTGINCTLTLLSSETRIKSTPQDPYAKLDGEDGRFVQNFAALQSIATSTGQNDSGLFELNFRDERYLPFEGNGAVSRWRIELPKNIRQFDYQTISDVILHIKYTARDGGAALRKSSDEYLRLALKGEVGKLQSRLFSLRHEFPTEWHKLVSSADREGNHSQTFSLDKQRFPIVFKSGIITVKKVDVYGNPKNIEDLPSLEKLKLSSPNGQILSNPDGLVQQDMPINLGPFVHLSLDVGALDPEIEVKDLGMNKNEAGWTIKVKKLDVPVSLGKLDDILVLLTYVVDMPGIKINEN